MNSVKENMSPDALNTLKTQPPGRFALQEASKDRTRLGRYKSWKDEGGVFEPLEEFHLVSGVPGGKAGEHFK